MFGSNQYMIDNLNRQKDKIDEMIRSYQNVPQPVNNFISTGQTMNKDMVEWRILNENEEVDNLYVANKTLFINENMMVLKGVDGSLEKWEVKKIWPIDKKDEKINALEEEVRKLKEVINNESAKSNESTWKRNESNSNVDGVIKSESKAISRTISE